MSPMADMAHVIIGTLGVALHTSNTPSRQEWDAWMVSLHDVAPSRLRVLAVTDGGGPNTLQRGALVKYLSGAKARIAVMSDALVVRGIITALSWFTHGIQQFSPDRYAEAAEHLDLSMDEQGAVKKHMPALAEALSTRVRAMRGI